MTVSDWTGAGRDKTMQTNDSHSSVCGPQKSLIQFTSTALSNSVKQLKQLKQERLRIGYNACKKSYR